MQRSAQTSFSSALSSHRLAMPIAPSILSTTAHLAWPTKGHARYQQRITLQSILNFFRGGSLPAFSGSPSRTAAALPSYNNRLLINRDWHATRRSHLVLNRVAVWPVRDVGIRGVEQQGALLLHCRTGCGCLYRVGNFCADFRDIQRHTLQSDNGRTMYKHMGLLQVPSCRAQTLTGHAAAAGGPLRRAPRRC